MKKLKTVNIKGKDYVEVHERLKFFREVYPEYTLDTQTIEKTEDTVMFKAVILNEQGRIIASGHAEERRGSSFINKTSYVENCETSATGRALAFLGFISDGIASAEEVSTAIMQQDKKIQTALKELEAVSHKGSYQEWLSKNKAMLGDLKIKNPIAYTTFMG